MWPHYFKWNKKINTFFFHKSQNAKRCRSILHVFTRHYPGVAGLFFLGFDYINTKTDVNVSIIWGAANLTGMGVVAVCKAAGSGLNSTL